MDIAELANENYEKATTITLPAKLEIPKLIVKQNGMESGFEYKMDYGSLMFIDWGDNQKPDMCVVCKTKRRIEHCYADESEHIISIYGDFSLLYLDLTDIGGTYYPQSEINIDGDFITPFPKNNIINTLINVNDEQND